MSEEKRKYSDDDLKEEAEAFDRHVSARIENGFIPDLRNLRKVEWFYNNAWREPEFARIHWFPVLEKIIKRAAENGGNVLEVGCGHGMLSLELARNNLKVTGIDLSSKSIETAREYGEKNKDGDNFGSLEYVCDDFMVKDFPEKSFDSIIFFRSLHHFPDIEGVMKKIEALLKPKGLLMLCEPIRSKFSSKSAEMTLLLRKILPTWRDYEAKLDCEWTDALWDKKVEEIRKEYAYEDHHHQSVMDNSIDCDKHILHEVDKYFKVDYLHYHDAFIDKIIGGLRGEHRFRLAKFLKFIDNYMVLHEILPPTSVTLFAIKK